MAEIRKRERQPICRVMIPPINGPSANPPYTEATEIPSTCPRFSAGNDATRIACPVVPEKAVPIPCRKRAATSQYPSGAM